MEKKKIITKVKVKVGRKSNYYTKVEPHLEEIKQWVRDGDTHKIMCERLDVKSATWYEYIIKYPELADILKNRPSININKTYDSIYRTAWGYEIPELVEEQFKEIWEMDKRTGKMVLTKREVLPNKITPKKIVLGNPAAQAMVLKLLDPRAREILSNNFQVTTEVNIEQLKAIADTLKTIGEKGIDTSQFDSVDDNDDE